MNRFATQAEARDGRKYGVRLDGTTCTVVSCSPSRPIMRGSKPLHRGDNQFEALKALVKFLHKKNIAVNWLRVPLSLAADPHLVDFPVKEVHDISLMVRGEQ